MIRIKPIHIILMFQLASFAMPGAAEERSSQSYRQLVQKRLREGLNSIVRSPIMSSQLEEEFRATAEKDIYFVSNSSTNREAFLARFRAGDGRIPSLWRAEDGNVAPCLEYVVQDGFTHLALDPAPASSDRLF